VKVCASIADEPITATPNWQGDFTVQKFTPLCLLMIIAIASDFSVSITSVHSQGKPTAPAGLFAEAQVVRGKAVYQKNCASCHGSGLAVHWLFAEVIDATYNELKSLSSNIVEPLQKMPWWPRRFTVEDLDGNRFYFHHDTHAA
jgi:hypothetical protein